jgi:hypothetical protein
MPLSVRNLVKMPLWVAALATGAKSFADNPIIGSRQFNAWGLHVRRLKLAQALAAFRRRRLAALVSEADRQAYHRDGFVIRENFLSDEMFQRLRNEIFENDWDVREMRQGNAVTRRVPLDHAELRTGKPVLADFIRNPEVLGLTQYAASTGGNPVFSLQAIFAGDDKGSADPQTTFHADTFQPNSKAWFFLHDVGIDDGPFAYVPGSNRLDEARLAWEYEQSLVAAKHPVVYHARGSFRASPDDLQRMGLPEPKRMVVKANTLVVGDTFGFHARTASPKQTTRIEIYASLRRNPFNPWNGLDFFSLPYVRDYTGSMEIRALEKLRWAGFKMPWKPVGRMRIDQPSGR